MVEGILGAWGTSLYSDDTTCDVREDYVANLRHGLSDEDAWQAIVLRYGQLLDRRDLACLVYFALADTAWRYGRLQAELRDKALALLEGGGDAVNWGDADRPSRQRALRDLEKRLRSPQPSTKAVSIVSPRSKTVCTAAAVGSTYLLTLPSGGKALFILVGFKDIGDRIDPVFSVPYWRNDLQLPPLDDVISEFQTISFRSGLGPKRHVAILPGDEQTDVMMHLEPCDAVITAKIPFEADSVVWLAIGRVAREIEAQLKDLRP